MEITDKHKVKSSKTCPECKNNYKQIAQHWRWNPSHRNNMDNELIEISKGLIMGDGTINRGNKNPRLEVSMINKEFLNFLGGKFGCFSNGVRLFKTAEEAAEENKGRELFDVVNVENYHDIYHWSTCGHPDLKPLADWYRTGKKLWPKNLNLTKNVLKYWYVSDGYYCNSGTSDYLTIALNNERKNKEKVENYFKRRSLPIPNKWKIYERSDGYVDCEILWNKENSYKIFDYMGSSLPGFEYKWPKGDGDNR